MSGTGKPARPASPRPSSESTRSSSAAGRPELLARAEPPKRPGPPRRPEKSGPGLTVDVPRRPAVRRVVIAALLAAVVLGATGWLLFGEQVLVVRSVVVTGNRLVPRDQVLAAARVRVGEPLIRLDTGAVRDRVETIRQVDVATVERDWPTTVHIVIHERVPVVSVQSGGRYLEIDRYGVTVMSLTAQPRGLLPLAVGDPVQSDPDLRAALAVRQALPPWLSGRVVSMTAASADSVSLRLGNGLTIEWGSPDQAVAKLQILRAMLVESPQHGLRMIDVSTPEVVTTQ